MHALVIVADDETLAIPFSWQQVTLHAAGATAARVRIVPVGSHSVSIELADALGLPVLSVGSMVRPSRDRTAAGLRAERRRSTGSCSKWCGHPVGESLGAQPDTAAADVEVCEVPDGYR